MVCFKVNFYTDIFIFQLAIELSKSYNIRLSHPKTARLMQRFSQSSSECILYLPKREWTAVVGPVSLTRGVVNALLPASYANPPTTLGYSFQVSILSASRGLRKKHTVAIKGEVLMKKRTANLADILATQLINNSRMIHNHTWKTEHNTGLLSAQLTTLY